MNPPENNANSKNPLIRVRTSLQKKLTLQKLLSSKHDELKVNGPGNSASSLKNKVDKDVNLRKNAIMSISTIWTPSLTYIGLISTWITVATMFYAYHNSWTYYESFYYSVQSGNIHRLFLNNKS